MQPCTINLANFIKNDAFDFHRFGEVTKTMITNLNNVIDRNLYHIEACRRSNFTLRPIGLGVQGLSTLFQRLNLPYCSEEAEKLNFQIFECMYYHAMKQSIELAKQHEPFEYFNKSILHHGHLQFEYSNKYTNLKMYSLINDSKWNILKEELIKFGCRNSLVIALPPTAVPVFFYKERNRLNVFLVTATCEILHQDLIFSLTKSCNLYWNKKERSQPKI